MMLAKQQHFACLKLAIGIGMMIRRKQKQRKHTHTKSSAYKSLETYYTIDTTDRCIIPKHDFDNSHAFAIEQILLEQQLNHNIYHSHN